MKKETMALQSKISYRTNLLHLLLCRLKERSSNT